MPNRENVDNIYSLANIVDQYSGWDLLKVSDWGVALNLHKSLKKKALLIKKKIDLDLDLRIEKFFSGLKKKQKTKPKNKTKKKTKNFRLLNVTRI